MKNFSLTGYPDEPAIFDSEETPENVAERKENTETEIEEYAKKEPEKPVNTQKFEETNFRGSDVVNITLHFFLKDIRPMLPPAMNHSIAVS